MTQQIRIALLSCWLGVMAFFSFVVAPSAFAVLPTQYLAGQIVSRTLNVAEIFGIVISIILLVILLFSRGRKGKLFLFEVVVTLLMLAAMALSRLVSSNMHSLRERAGEGLYLLLPTDPIRSGFDQLHQYSVGLMGFTMLAAVALIGLLVRRKGNDA
ncbi:MAG: DUF4149 domain-containing protein [Blastocatellales bacterium]